MSAFTSSYISFFKNISYYLLTYFPFLRHTLVLNEYKKIMEYVFLHEGAFTNGNSHKMKPGSKRCDDSRCEVH